MEVYRRSSWLLLLLGVSLLATTLQGVQGEVEPEGPSESECRPYIEKALKELEIGEGAEGAEGAESTESGGDSKEDLPTIEITTDDSDQNQTEDGDNASIETEIEPDTQDELDAEPQQSEEKVDEQEAKSDDEAATDEVKDDDPKDEEGSKEDDQKSEEASAASKEDEAVATEAESTETEEKQEEAASKEEAHSQEDTENKEEESKEQANETDTREESAEQPEKVDEEEEKGESKEEEKAEESSEDKDKAESKEEAEEQKESVETKEESVEEAGESKEEEKKEESREAEDSKAESAEESKEEAEPKEQDEGTAREKRDVSAEETKEDDKASEENKESVEDDKTSKEDTEESAEDDEKKSAEEGDGESAEEAPEDELTLDIEIPDDLRSRDHVEQLLKIDQDSTDTENIINKVSDVTLKELKKLYENAIKPLEVLYKYRDLSNRHFGDAEIFSKPLILFMGPWSGGKSSIVNYLTNNEFNETSLRTGAEPSPAYFNILMHGNEPEVVDGTEMAADFTFSGLQKFGQGLEERLRGVKLPSKLLEKVNIVEIPGILEVRKQISRVFPFNDACQWFIDRADIIFLVYDPSKLDVGPETEAILDQLKGREHQTRIILNKADQVKPEELMRVQGALIWNISPLMSSPQPPIMYTTSLWSRPYESWAPVRLLQAQERAFLRDLRGAIDKRIENRIASARRFAVRVRNHAKMVDCYLTTYYNHKSVFGNRKQVADAIIEHPQDYHIYEGLSTLTNISRYDLPDPDVYKEFFKLNPLYDFQQLSATCTYFRGCPINRLDVAIAYDLPELVGTHRRNVETALAEANPTSAPGS
ncbi:unnamed protein product [Brassicogethes aeneus]|uniref:Dynamin-type G domain-containing protein n=1 Tax=Brassicogethes aeneus TaxID=1431903 RepID=A0A9P0FMZ0_BRAAE|nr:unnamed protein product [Brassicogethes aeneus]